MTLSEIAQYRVFSQQLATTHLRTASEMTAWLGAVQAQEYAQTQWSLGLRLPHLKNHDVEKDFNEGRILRTHLLRPTWHFVAAEDIQWLLELTASRVAAANAHMYRKLELEKKLFGRCNDLIIQSLEGGRQCTRAELNAVFGENNIVAEGLRLSYIMMNAELEGIICSGARRGNQFTYALLEERLLNAETKSREEALAVLSNRYFTSRGPATIKDFSTWSGLTLTDCKKCIELIKADLEHTKAEGDVYYFYPGIGNLSGKKMQEMYLLPIYDEFIMGYKSRNAILVNNSGIFPKPMFHYDCTIVWGGQIIGTWKRTMHAYSIDVSYDFFKPLSVAQAEAFEMALGRFKDFTGLKINKLTKGG